MMLPSKFLQDATVSLHGNVSADRPLSGRPISAAIMRAVAQGMPVQAVLVAMPRSPAEVETLSRWPGATHVSMYDPAGQRASYNVTHRPADVSSQQARAEFHRRAGVMVAFGGQEASPLSDAGLGSQIIVTQFEGPTPRLTHAAAAAKPSDVHERAQRIVHHQARMSI